MSKLIVVTGASSGIGEATAKQLSSEGFSLLLLARRVEKLEALNLPNTLCRQVDITDLESFRSAVAEAEEKFGPVDGLVNNAGVMLLGNADVQDPAEWKQMFDVNVLGLLNGIHLVLEKMKARKTGTVINISSVAGRKTFPSHAAYCGTKFAVHAITENIREEVADDSVRMITIAPGAVETDLLSHTTNEDIISGYQEWKEGMGGAIAPQDIANAISYAYNQPQNVCVREIVIAATRQPA
ncbi:MULTISPECIES: SDR family oxidoreductase [Vibrio]|uniref:Oxidoreductase n=1 Tax=Vibrio genomosp. F6 str. FF-238 TaxID=1191298 RepID=A0A1E5CMI5_9VIBR|nr:MULTISPECIES: SDR family oxidoreductase [Vibrio]MDN3696650.1 SDR family oxidoreductase [Vibrio cortegadensis]OEE70836.1 oxidoreductase [Vibrio genomosp. F6 str. FF-238]RBW64470.1 SDR family NAD(P)-dependent oxidoreductase [Vibrionales bacterium C3R12]TKF18774.1 SDR family oxidoreductase [Vibrio genomosp. F6]